MKNIELTNEEFLLLRDLVENHLYENSPIPTEMLLSLAFKLELDKETIYWIKRRLNSRRL